MSDVQNTTLNGDMTNSMDGPYLLTHTVEGDDEESPRAQNRLEGASS